MPTKLYYFKTLKQLLKWCRERGYSKKACREAWTGPGYYYARSRKHISKHVPHLDRRRGGKIGSGPWRHVHDFEKAVRRLRKYVKNRVDKTVKRVARKLSRKVGRRKAVKAAKTLVLTQIPRRARKARVTREVREIADYLWSVIPRKYREGKDKVWTYIAVLALAKYIHRKAREKSVDWRAFDWKEEIDWREGYRYAKSIVDKLIGYDTKYIEIPEEEIIRRLKELEQYGKVEIEVELDPAKLWELKHLW